MSTLLAFEVNQSFSLPGPHQLTLTGIVWGRPPTDEEFRVIDAQAQVVDKINAWLDGDVCAEYVRREQANNPGRTVLGLLNDYALAREKSPDVTLRRYKVALAYPASHRVSGNGISWSHHEVVWAAGVSPLLKAVDMLKLARERSWSVADLRAHLRKEMRPAPSSEPRLPGFLSTELQRAVDWAAARLDEVNDMPQSAVEQLLAEAQPLATYIDALRARVATPTKESITSPSQRR